MDLLIGAGSAAAALLLVLALLPLLAGLAAGIPSRFRAQRAMGRAFDFFADLLYPWRWKFTPHRQREQTMKTVTIYTDGACSGNPGPGG